MNFIELKFKLQPFYPFQEILVAKLSDYNFNSFVEEEPFLMAYIEEKDYDSKFVDLLELDELETLSYEVEEKVIEKENWNKKWEESFEAVIVSDFCSIRAPFHPPITTTKFEIIIEPKMSFGTGHHETTKMMIRQMQQLNLTDKTVLDMGSGTGVLAILAEKMQSALIHAIDIEEWAFENMNENFEKNGCKRCKGYLGDVSTLDALNFTYDLILANINKNILLNDLPRYIRQLSNTGVLILSGFFHYDNAELIDAAKRLGLDLVRQYKEEDWSSLSFVKK